MRRENRWMICVRFLGTQVSWFDTLHGESSKSWRSLKSLRRPEPYSRNESVLLIFVTWVREILSRILVLSAIFGLDFLNIAESPIENPHRRDTANINSLRKFIFGCIRLRFHQTASFAVSEFDRSSETDPGKSPLLRIWEHRLRRVIFPQKINRVICFSSQGVLASSVPSVRSPGHRKLDLLTVEKSLDSKFLWLNCLDSRQGSDGAMKTSFPSCLEWMTWSERKLLWYPYYSGPNIW